MERFASRAAGRIALAGVVAGSVIVGGMCLDARAWSGIETALCWILGVALFGGFVALMVKYPKFASAVQTVLLVFIALGTVSQLMRPRRR